MVLMLLISSSVALCLLVVHSWRTRGRFVTLTFVIVVTVFGILRGNSAWLVMVSLTGRLDAEKPYHPQSALLPDIGHASIQVALGWVFSLYLAWTISELILRRLARPGEEPRLVHRVFAISALSALFMCCMCYCMEVTAVTVGWWYWDACAQSMLEWSMRAWFSVAHDCLMPFLVIVCSTYRSRLRWLWLLAFPIHKFFHVAQRWTSYTVLIHHVMALFMIALLLYARLRMARGEMGKSASPARRIVDVLPAVALAIFLGVLTTANLVKDAGMANLMTLVPLLMLCLLAWRPLPVWVVLGLSVVSLGGWVWVGSHALWAVVPVGVYGVLMLLERLREPRWLRASILASAVVLAVWAAAVSEADTIRAHRYLAAWREGDGLSFAGKTETAAEAYRKADRLRPEGPQAAYAMVRIIAQPGKDLTPQQAVRVLELRMPRLVQEFEAIIRLDPGWPPPRQDLARLHLLLGRIPDAAGQYREILRRQPIADRFLAMFGYLLLREQKITEAEEVCVRASRLGRPPLEAVINLGVIRFHQGRSEEARALWEQARKVQPDHPIVRLNLERLDADVPPQTLDERYLARPIMPHVAEWANGLAALGPGRSDFEKVQLLREALQFDPCYVTAHQNLVRVFYLPERSAFHSQVRALWHARRAVELSREARNGTELAESLLLLGRVLLAGGKSEEAAGVLREGRSKAAPALRPEFDRLLREAAH